jgi:hypothetical protein
MGKSNSFIRSLDLSISKRLSNFSLNKSDKGTNLDAPTWENYLKKLNTLSTEKAVLNEKFESLFEIDRSKDLMNELDFPPLSDLFSYFNSFTRSQKASGFVSDKLLSLNIMSL